MGEIARTAPLFTGPAPGQLRCFNTRCGHVWMQRGHTPPVRCPRCQSRHWFNPSYPFTARARPAPAPPTAYTPTAPSPEPPEPAPPHTEEAQ